MITLGLEENGMRTYFDFGSFLYDRHTSRDNIVTDLKSCLDKISKASLHSKFHLSVHEELITQPALSLFVQLLNQPYISQVSSTTEPNAITGDETTKWDSMDFYKCRLAVPDSSRLETLENAAYCSPDDIQIFGSTLALRTKVLTLDAHECPHILHALCGAPKLEVSDWNIDKREFSALDCARLANCLSRNARRSIILRLCSDYLEDPLVLAEGLVNVKELYLFSARPSRWSHSKSARPSYPCRGDVLLGEGGTGMMQRILQSPSSRLNILSLTDTQLEDRHFMAILDMLPTSQLEELFLTCNKISLHGIMAVAHHLPRITSLRKMIIGGHDKPEENPVHPQECCMALRRGMHQNYSIEELRVGVLDLSGHNDYCFYADLNYAGRRILRTSKPVPAGLWPWILERAGTKCFRDHGWWKTMREQEIMRFDSIYFLLQNCPALLADQ